jgi:hypothetical protein
MDERNIQVLYQRYEWISYRLEREAYSKQMKGRSGQLKQFIPCQKALVFTTAMGIPGGQVSSVTIKRAALTICTCHPGLGESDLWSMFDQATKEIPYCLEANPKDANHATNH